MNKEEKKRTLTLDELDAIMTPGDLVHTFIGGGICILGCEMEREEILRLAKEYGAELAGPGASSMGHGAAVYNEAGMPTFVETHRASIQDLKD